jgi:hypothetical protein
MLILFKLNKPQIHLNVNHYNGHTEKENSLAAVQIPPHQPQELGAGTSAHKILNYASDVTESPSCSIYFELRRLTIKPITDYRSSNAHPKSLVPLSKHVSS